MIAGTVMVVDKKNYEIYPICCGSTDISDVFRRCGTLYLELHIPNQDPYSVLSKI